MQATTLSAADRRITLIALLAVFLLAALDRTILSTAMPRIVEDLNGLALYAWATTAYMVTSTVLVPIYGKLGDMIGRTRILIIGLVIFLLGSFFGGLSGEFGPLPLLGDGMHQLIFSRAFKGIGGAALFTIAIAILADLYPPRQRARFMGLFGAVFGFANIVGPAVGGLLTDYANTTLFGYHIAGWRWVFYVNIPLGLLALLIIVTKAPKFEHRLEGKIDYLGALLIVIAFVPFLLALTWVGRNYSWNSPTIIAMFTCTAGAIFLFVIVERRVQQPILPLTLFRNSLFTLTNLLTFVNSMAFFGIVMFMPLYMQTAQGVSATNSGIAMFPLMAGSMLSSLLAGRWVSRHGYYKPILVSANFILAVGVYFFSIVSADTSSFDLAWRMFIVGVGLGPFQSLTNIVVQSAVAQKNLGVATSTTQFFRQVGATIGVALFGTFFNFYLSSELPQNITRLPDAIVEQIDLNQAQAIANNPEIAGGQIDVYLSVVLDQVRLAYAGDSAARSQVATYKLVPDNVQRELSTTPSLSNTEIAERVQFVQSRLRSQRDELVGDLTRGTRTAFSNAIGNMYLVALLIVTTGFFVSCFIPVIALRTKFENEKPD